MTAIQTGPVAEVVDGEFFLRLDPHALDIGANVRDEVDLSQTPDFVESVRDYGVLEAISAVQHEDGRIVVREGQRRTLAARETGQASIPVIVRLDTTTDEKARGIARITAQMEANDQRLALTPGQRAAGAADLLDLGMSVAKVAKTVREDKTWVEQAGRIGKSAAARAAVDEDQMDFEQAAIWAEFDGDDDATARLKRGPWWRLQSVAQEIRADRLERAQFEEAAAPYVAQGFTVLPDHPGPDAAFSRLDLRTHDGGAVTIEQVESNPQSWIAVLMKLQVLVDTKTGQVIDESAVDQEVETDSAGIEPGDRLVHVDTLIEEERWVPEYVCADPEAAGLQLSPVMAAVRADGADVDPKLTAGDPRAEAERRRLQAAAKAKRKELAAEEKVRRDRKMVRVLNVKAEAATVVRRDFLRKLLAAKALPKGAAAYIAAILAGDTYLLTEHRAYAVYKELFGIKGPDVSGYISDQVAKSSAGRAQVLTLALVLGAQESRMEKDAWRSKPRGADQYLAFLSEHGHQLTPVEDIIRGGMLPQQVVELDE